MKHTQQVALTVDAILVAATHDRGRPTKAEEMQIEITLRPFFARSYSATFTAHKTGYDIKTVLRHFENFKKEILAAVTQDFIERSKETKEQYLATCDEMLYSDYEELKHIENIIAAAEAVGELQLVEKFYNLKRKIKKEILDVSSSKINVTNTATAADISQILKGERQK